MELLNEVTEFFEQLQDEEDPQQADPLVEPQDPEEVVDEEHEQDIVDFVIFDV